jgi:hypothetical protein
MQFYLTQDFSCIHLILHFINDYILKTDFKYVIIIINL